MAITSEQADSVRSIALVCLENHYNTDLQLVTWYRELLNSRDSRFQDSTTPPRVEELKRWRDTLKSAKDEFDSRWTPEVDDTFILRSPWEPGKRFGERGTASQRARDLCCEALFAVDMAICHGIETIPDRKHVPSQVTEADINEEWKAVRRGIDAPRLPDIRQSGPVRFGVIRCPKGIERDNGSPFAWRLLNFMWERTQATTLEAYRAACDDENADLPGEGVKSLLTKANNSIIEHGRSLVKVRGEDLIRWSVAENSPLQQLSSN